ncbi:VOC family protein [Rhizobium sp. ARZ01]|uniref:VOC family protein n=1 Tax=Rhizobium sp. ARZ01 TaxID=2769313 RepID=UPI00177F5214|nr:VOC family protein [Rhizobium sp. ARZ01]MBD9371941.1 VOC family protein [Rhizobium sp. ARZ01]
MSRLALHHVSIITNDLERSLSFYRDVLGLTEIQRPNFPIRGAWLACGSLQLHLVVHPEGSFRSSRSIDRNDWHFALRTDEFERVVQRLIDAGFREDLPEGDPMRLLIARSGPAGFPQLYLCDPDRNVVEVNGAA